MAVPQTGVQGAKDVAADVLCGRDVGVAGVVQVAVSYAKHLRTVKEKLLTT